MVRVEKQKLIIEIDLAKDEKPEEALQEIQDGITECIECYNYKDFGENPPTYYLLRILRATLPTREQQQAILKSK